MKIKKLGLIIWTVLIFFMIIYIGPMDGFYHGCYSEEIDFSRIKAGDWLEKISLENPYEMQFSPLKNHLSGASIYLTNHSADNEGELVLTISDLERRTLDEIYVDLNDIVNEEWYKVNFSSDLKKDDSYYLKFEVNNCAEAPFLQTVSSDYLSKETSSGNILISYAYAESTWTFQEKIIIGFFLIAIWLYICGVLVPEKKKYCQGIAIGVFLTMVLSWNYMHNSMDTKNTSYQLFQGDSETLVSSVIYAERAGEYFRNDDEIGYGLGRHYDLKGSVNGYDRVYATDDNCTNGYSNIIPAIVVNPNIYTEEVAVAGNYIEFSNGKKHRIMGVDVSDIIMVIHLDSEEILEPLKYGSLDDAVFYDAAGNELPRGRITAYKSQYGLQGKVYRHLSRYMEEEHMIANLHLISSILTATVFVLIVMILACKYNNLLATCFFVTFWLSPWVVNFARNLYWVEFTWFVPMLIGLFCAWKIDNKWCRRMSYIAALIAITCKALCGYEYISAIMVGLIAFLFADFIKVCFERKRESAMLLLRTIIIIGVVALIGFVLAICMHAELRGNGNVINGIKIIFEEDVLRTTNGTDFNQYTDEYFAGVNASAWEVYSRYFKFSTEIITGIEGNLFPLLCVVPLCIFAYEQRKKILNIELLALYCIFFLSSISWFCLAKSHSYIHTHMNFVLWYFGYVQICFYIIANKILGKSTIGQMRKE